MEQKNYIHPKTSKASPLAFLRLSSQIADSVHSSVDYNQFLIDLERLWIKWRLYLPTRPQIKDLAYLNAFADSYVKKLWATNHDLVIWFFNSKEEIDEKNSIPITVLPWLLCYYYIPGLENLLTQRASKPIKTRQLLAQDLSKRFQSFITSASLKLQLESEKIDLLTWLNSRRTWSSLFKRAVKKRIEEGNTSMGFVIFLDIDNFKLFNTKYWHSGWDDALRYVSSIIKASIDSEPTYSDIPFRYWWEEIVIYCPNRNEYEAELFARTLCAAIGESVIRINRENVSVTVSIGISWEWKMSNETRSCDLFDHMIIEANTAMRYVKENGKNGVVIYHPSQDSAVGGNEKPNSVRRAIRK